jgi:hypothetical protein
MQNIGARGCASDVLADNECCAPCRTTLFTVVINELHAFVRTMSTNHPLVNTATVRNIELSDVRFADFYAQERTDLAHFLFRVVATGAGVQ